MPPEIKQYHLITCILHQGQGLKLVEKLHKEKGIPSSHIHHGRGRSSNLPQQFSTWVEVDTVSVVVEKSQAEILFDYIFTHTDIQQLHGGFMYMNPLGYSTSFELPELGD